MGLGNPLEASVHHLLIGVMTGLGHRDEFPMMSALVWMVMITTQKVLFDGL